MPCNFPDHCLIQSILPEKNRNKLLFLLSDGAHLFPRDRWPSASPCLSSFRRRSTQIIAVLACLATKKTSWMVVVRRVFRLADNTETESPLKRANDRSTISRHCDATTRCRHRYEEVQTLLLQKGIARWKDST